MRRLLCLAFALTATTLAPADEAKETVKKDLDRLQGAWTATALTFNGADFLANGKAAGFRFAFKGDEVVVEGNDAVQKEYARLKLKLDPAAAPRLVDLTVTGGVQKDAVLEGIYELKDDELKLCVRVFGKDRPTEFASPAGASIALVVLKRDKP